MRFLLRPGWIAFTVGVVAFAFTCAYLLAPWQFSRSDQRDGVNLALERAVAEAPVPREQLVAPGTAPTPAVEWRQVSVTGTYVPEGEVLVRLRSIDGGAASEVLTPLRTTTGETVLVDRGYLPLASGPTSPAPAPPGTVTVVGYQHPDEPASDRAPVLEGGSRQVYAADTTAIGALTGVTAAPGYVQLLPDQPGVLTATPLPRPDPNSSFSYAWQWLIFGVMAVGAWVYVVRLEYVTRRRDGGDPRDVDPRDPRDDPRAPAPVPSAARTRTTSEVLADRYGRR